MFENLCWRVKLTEITFLSYLSCFSYNFPLALTNIQCTTQGDCNEGQNISCGICIKYEDSVTGKCIFPFPYMFKESEKCTVIAECKGSCSNHGVCTIENLMIPYCVCNEGFYGKNCENSASKNMTRMIFPKNRVTFLGVQKPFEETKRPFYFQCYPELHDFRAVLESETVGTFHFEISFPLNLCKGGWVVANIINRFPYKSYEHTDILQFGNEVLGYLSDFRVKATVNGVLNYQSNFAVFVSYQETNLVCVPAIKLSGCSPKKKYSNIFTRSNLVKVSSNVVYFVNGRYISTSEQKPECKENANYHWKLWEGYNKLVNESYEIKDLSIAPYSLKFGDHKVLLEVTVMQEKPSQNFAYCYFRIEFTPLVAVIDGGSERIVPKNYGLILSTTRSLDPNMPPDKQDHMQASWSCVDVSKPNIEICNPSLSLSVSNNYNVSSEKLSYGAVYNVTLEVKTNYYDSCTGCGNVGPAFDYAIITVANKTDEEKDYIYIQCLLNCKKKVIHSQLLYLRVKTGDPSSKRDHKFKWTYYESGQTTEKDFTNLTVEGLPSYMFLLKENAFRSGQKYVVVVRIVNNTWYAKYAFHTKEVEFNGNCSITPNSGVKGLSLFEIQCQNYSGSPTYEFYDKTPEEAKEGIMFSGRMLGTSEHSEIVRLKHFRVTRGEVLVYIIDNSGLYTQQQFTVDLLPWNVTEELIGQIFLNLTELLNQGESANMLEYVSSVPDIIPFEMDKHEILNKLLYFITLVPTDTLADIKLTTSTMSNVLLTLNKPVQLIIDTELMRNILHIVRRQTLLLYRIVSEGTALKGMSPQEIRIVATYQLNCLHAALMSKDPTTVGITEFDFDLKSMDILIACSNFAEDAIYLIKDILTFLQAPGLPPTNISAAENSLIVWVVENDEEYNLTNYLSEYEKIPAIVSNKLITEFYTDLRDPKIQESLAVRVATLDENIFWWSKSDIKSNLVSVSLAKHSKSDKLGRIKYLKNAVGMQLMLPSGLNSTQVKGIAMPYNDSKTVCTFKKDLTIDIHRLDPELYSLISINFLFPLSNGSLLVHVEKDRRPDCIIMKKFARVINESFPIYKVIAYEEVPTFYFVGILPNANVSVTYTFEVNTTVCQFWAEGHWSSKGCKISKETKGVKAHCKCDHFSIFGAAFPVPPQEIDLLSDINLFLTVIDNPLMVSFVLIILILYLICCFWAWLKDKKDKSLKNVIILNDNFPEDRFSYLLVIYTSSRFNAGTTANVGININGSLAKSRSHILSSKGRKVLKRNYDDWFVLYCPELLGDLQSIHLWHDNSGSSPDWFCDKVIVYDLQDNTEIVFVVEEWIALRLTYFPEATVVGASVSKVNNVKRMFLDNCILGLREGHTLLCIILRHPRSEISRLQRISILMCLVMASMLCSIMFFSPGIDDNEYSVGLREFYISIESLVISILITALVLFAFKRSYVYKHTKKRSTIQYKSSGYEELEEANVQSKNEKSAYTNFVRFVSKTMKGHPLIPAQLEHSKPALFIRKKSRIIAWVLCIGVIITCSFFIMMYGLKLGLVKSKIWLSSVFFTLSEDFFVSTPAKILLYSIILSIAFQKMCETDNHRVEGKDMITVRPDMNEEQIEKMLIKRRHKMYAPLREDFKNEMLRKKELWSNWWTVIDFTVALIFIFVLSMVVFELWSSHYYNNSSIKNMIVQSPGYERFFSFSNKSQVDKFLAHTLLRSLYTTFWYNKTLIKETESIDREQYWAEDFTHTMVGYQRYRQIRVSPAKCKFTSFLNTTRKCLSHYKSATEDIDEYGLRWKPAQWHDINITNSPWKYTDMSRSRFSTLYRLCGESGVIFHNGGYLTDLGPTKTLAESKAYEIVSNNWQDQQTRAVFVEFTLFNINLNLFSQVTITVEYLISGSIQLKVQVVSVESKMKLSFWNALFVAFVVYYVIRTGYLINRLGLFEYLSTSSRNRSRVVVVILGILSISVAAIHYFESTACYEHFINSGYGDTYFDFDSFVYYFIQLQAILSFLLAVAIFRTILIFRGGRSLLNYFYTFTISLPWIFWLSIIICIFLLVQVHLIILLNIFSFYSVTEIVMNLMFTQYLKAKGSELKYLQIFLYVKFVAVNILLIFYILIFMHYFRIARTYKMKNSDKFNLISFVLGQLRKTKKKN